MLSFLFLISHFLSFFQQFSIRSSISSLFLLTTHGGLQANQCAEHFSLT